MIVAEDDLVDLIARHIASLTEIVLDNCPLEPRDWASITRRLNHDIFAGYLVMYGEEDFVRYEQDSTPAFTLRRVGNLRQGIEGLIGKRHPSHPDHKCKSGITSRV